MTLDGQAPVIVAVRRTAVGRAGGVFRSRSVDQLAGPVIRAVLGAAPLAPESVDAVYLGNAVEGGNVARRAALAGGVPPETPAYTVDRQCTSGLDTILDAIRQVASGAGEVVLAGGVESCSTAPWRVARPASPTAMPRFIGRAPFSAPPYADPDPVDGADALAAWAGIDRAAQDAWTVRSHANAVLALRAGRLEAERVRIFDPERPESDEAPKPGLTAARLARLKPLAGPGGTVTAATAAPEADAAVIALILSAARARALGVRHGLVLEASAAAGCDPALAGYAAVPAISRLWHRCGDPTGVSRIEFNEAFAGQALTCIQAAGLPVERVSQHGGALAFGHPYGASGAFLVCRLWHDMSAGERGLAALSAMGGQGTAALFRAVSLAGSATADCVA